jgi:hypothetical protein
MLSFESAELEARLLTSSIARRAVLNAVLDVQAAVFSRLRSFWLFSLSLAFRRGFWLRIVGGFELYTGTASHSLIDAADVQNDREQN